MGLHWGASKLESLVGTELWSDIPSAQCDPAIPTSPNDMLKFLNAATGEIMMATQVPHFYRLRRSALRQLLVRDVDVRYNKDFSGLTFGPGDNATAHFSDGTSTTARQLIGADGVHSTVRRALLGAGPHCNPVSLDFGAILIHASYTTDQARFLRSFHPLYLAGVHPANKVAFLSCHDASSPDPAAWRFAFYISYPCTADERARQACWTAADVLRRARELAHDFVDPWRSAIAWLPDLPVGVEGDDDAAATAAAAAARGLILNIIPLSSWDPEAPAHTWPANGGRATLAGDAAHVMTFQRGQALNHAMADAVALTRAAVAARDAGWDPAVRERGVATYEVEMRERAGEEVRLCDVNTAMVHDWEKAKLSPIWNRGLSEVE